MSPQPQESNADAQSSETTPASNARTGKLFFDLFVCVIIPTLILKKLSGENQLGPMWAFALAISLPLIVAIYEMANEKKVGFVSALGFISIMLTGGIGLLKLPKEYIAYKEALIPSVFALAAYLSTHTKKPLVRLFLYNDMLIDTQKINRVLDQKGNTQEFGQITNKATIILALSFVLSAVLNFVLAKTIIVSETGTEAFNDELGTMTLLSYPVIVLPCMAVMFYILFYMFKHIHRLTDLEIDEIVHQ